MHLAIRADGGPNIGYGHLVRTGALAECALDTGDSVTYATRTPGNAREVCPEGVEVVGLDSGHGHAAFLEWLSEVCPDVVLTDSYDVDTEQQQSIVERVPRLGVVLDDTRFTIRADVLINGNVYAPDIDYEWLGPEPAWCLGTDYLLLRAEIRELAGEEPLFRETAERALITMGGSDIRNTTPQVVRAFDGTDLCVDVIVGPGFENRAAIDEAVAETEGEFDVVEDPPDLPERMFRADLAVSATGTTIYELLALGTPTIGLPQADNQEPIADALTERNAIVMPDGEDADSLRSTIDSLANDPKRRRSILETGRALVDGRGVERVYEILSGHSPGSR